jgi:hypothetical protein
MRTHPWFVSPTALRRIATGAFTLVLLAMFVPLAHPSDAKGAMLYANGDVAVNGVKVRNTMAVFAGDKIQVGNNSTAAILSVAAVKFVPANSSVILGNATTQLNSSTALASQFVDTKAPQECPHPSKRPGHDCGISKSEP